MMGKVGAALGATMMGAARMLPALVWNLIGLSGVAAMAYGAWLIYQPAGFIVGGILLLAGAAVLAPRGA